MRQPWRIEGLALHEVGVFNDVRLDFQPIQSAEQDEKKAEIHLFTGPNGCGKSTLLYAIAGIFDRFQRSSLIRKRFRGAQGCVDFKFADKAGKYCVSKPEISQADNLIDGPFGISREMQWTESDGLFYSYDLANGWAAELGLYMQRASSFQAQNSHTQSRFEFVAFAYSGQRTLRDMPLGAIQQITNSPFEAALSFDGTSRPQVLLQWIANNRAQSALAKADGDVASAASYDRALNRITGLIQEICELNVEFRLERSPLSVSIRVGEKAIPFDGLPDGLKSIISWVADLSLRLEAIPWANPSDDVFTQPVILLLDEVDIHLHPRWQRRILPAVQKLLPNAQVFVSTHSPFVIGSVEDAWVYRLPEPGTQTGLVTIKGMPAGAGKSYRLILEEVFGIKGEFDIETESLLDEFYAAREAFLMSRKDPSSLQTLAKKLADRGEESAQIVARELRQISRISGLEIGLA